MTQFAKKSIGREECRPGMFNGNLVIISDQGLCSICSGLGEFSLLDCALPINQLPL